MYKQIRLHYIIYDTFSPGNLWFDWKQIATVLILPQCNSMMYLK